MGTPNVRNTDQDEDSGDEDVIDAGVLLDEAEEIDLSDDEGDRGPNDDELVQIALDTRGSFVGKFIPGVDDAVEIPAYRRVDKQGDDRTTADFARDILGLPEQRLEGYAREVRRIVLTSGGTNDSINPENALRLHLHHTTHEIPSGEYAGVTVDVIGWREWMKEKKGSAFGRMSISWQALNAQFTNEHNPVWVRFITGKKHGEIRQMTLRQLAVLK